MVYRVYHYDYNEQLIFRYDSSKGIFMLDLINTIFKSNLFSLFAGSLLTFIFAYLINKKTQSDAYSHKIAEKRIEAYENLIDNMRKLNHFFGIKDTLPNCCKMKDVSSGHKLSFAIPEIFISEEEYWNFMYNFMNSFSQYRIWVDVNTSTELEFIGDYFGCCWNIIHEKPEEEIRLVGLVLANEIEDIYNNFEDIIRVNLKKRKIEQRVPKTYDRSYDIRAKRKYSTILYRYFIKPRERIWFGAFEYCRNCSEIIGGKECPIKNMKI
jgi:hypothetical protein